MVERHRLGECMGRLHGAGGTTLLAQLEALGTAPEGIVKADVKIPARSRFC